MTTYRVFRYLYVVVAISCFATAFVPPTASPTTVSRNRIAPLTVLPSAQLLSARAPLDRGARDAVAALQMSDYDAGGYDGGGSQEVRMEMQELHVEFTGDGRILLEVKGVKGAECREITEDLIKALGNVIHTENTSEYFEEKVKEVNVDAVKVKNGWSYDSNMPEW